MDNLQVSTQPLLEDNLFAHRVKKIHRTQKIKNALKDAPHSLIISLQPLILLKIKQII